MKPPRQQAKPPRPIQAGDVVHGGNAHRSGVVIRATSYSIRVAGPYGMTGSGGANPWEEYTHADGAPCNGVLTSYLEGELFREGEPNEFRVIEEHAEDLAEE